MAPYIPKYLPKPNPAFGLKPDPRNTCELCGKPAFELRPFGPNQESICEDCADKDKDATDARWRLMTVDAPKHREMLDAAKKLQDEGIAEQTAARETDG